ncbi:Glycoside hydrolase [Parasponia andersonii]|uniref:Glycoside hydrolase n=1 Tax=Parasponia andersonii TaxID=3476 RepID=A0A2P5C310_PARAD|nr:Glycoside hydrolase [Parasponia andersonii]
MRYPRDISGAMACSEEEIIEDTIYLEVGKLVQMSKSVLFRALQNSGGKKICILHVHMPTQMIPLNGLGTKVNVEGITHYNNIINAMLQRGIKPYVTLYHWDLFLDLHETMGGWLNKELA